MKQKPVQRPMIWEKTDINVVELNFGGGPHRSLEVRLQIAEIHSTPGHRRPNVVTQTPWYVLPLDAAESLAQQLAEVVRQAKAMQASAGPQQ
jgi:hypothetical protein